MSPPAYGFSKGARGTEIRKDRDLAKVSPFSYSMTMIDKRKEAAYSMGAKLESSLVNKNACAPSPNAYEPNVTLSKLKSPESKFGTATRQPSYDSRKAKLVPGAGTYDIKSVSFNTLKPKFYIGQKLNFDDTMKYIHSIPGPGTHDPTHSVIKTKSPIYSMGARLMATKDTTAIVPGPGTYVNSSEKLRTSAPSFGFGTSKRPEIGGNNKQNTPGPGTYKVPVRVADVPTFELPNRNLEFKNV